MSAASISARVGGFLRTAAEVPLVLVVDDSVDTRELYAFCLAKAGYRVSEATDGQAALDAIARTTPALVLMDLDMPVLDGWVAIRRIKSDPLTTNIIVIVVTGNVTTMAFEAATAAGADALVAKPCTPSVLLRNVDAWLR